MRIALISDLHANEVALQSVLTDIHKHGVDQLVCLGDVATLGPNPSSVIAMLQILDCKFIKGNHDDFLIDPELIHQYTEAPIVIEAVDWCRNQLSSSELNFLKSFENTIKIDMNSETPLLLFHGAPHSHMVEILSTTSTEELDRLLNDHTASIMACGHTHIQMLRQHRGVLIVNPGSVGLPFKEHISGNTPNMLLSHAEYAIVEANTNGININLRRVTLDKKKLRAMFSASDNPLCELLLQQCN